LCGKEQSARCFRVLRHGVDAGYLNGERTKSR
jgi:hypothetical protein